jgi:hypothetical protein
MLAKSHEDLRTLDTTPRKRIITTKQRPLSRLREGGLDTATVFLSVEINSWYMKQEIKQGLDTGAGQDYK